MKVIIAQQPSDAFEQAAQIILRQIADKPASKLGLATGGTAQNIYPYLVAAYAAGRADFSSVTTVNLDEYIGLDKNHPQSYSRFMEANLFELVNIQKQNTYVADGGADIEQEICRFNIALQHGGTADLQLLGVGVSGHIGFNEPSDNLVAGVHTETLLQSTIASNQRYFGADETVPQQAITMGMGDVLKAKKILLVATGSSKIHPIRALLNNDLISTNMPITFLKLHPHVTVIIDSALAKAAGV